MKRFTAVLMMAIWLALAVNGHGDGTHYPKVQDPVFKTTKVTDKIYMLQGGGGNIAALTGPDGILLVDDDYRKVSESLAQALKELGSPSPRYILNTHWHADHTQGNEFFGKESVIMAHANVRKRMSQVNTLFGNSIKPSPAIAWPVVTYTESMTVYINGEEVRMVHYPDGHTDGDSIIFFVDSNVVHLGDDFFVGAFPFVDLDNGGSVRGLIANVADLMATIPADAKIIPGHGPVATLTDLKDYHRIITETVKIIDDKMKAGRSLDEIKKEGLPESYAKAGAGFIKTPAWIETVYRDLSRK
jgi:cyclase